MARVFRLQFAVDSVGCSSSRGPYCDLFVWGIFYFCSEEKAKDAVLYHYKHAASGFSAKLTNQQVEDLKSEFPFICSLAIRLYCFVVPLKLGSDMHREGGLSLFYGMSKVCLCPSMVIHS